MFTNNKMVEVFRDTTKWIESDETLSSSVNESIRKTKVYYENDYPEYADDKHGDTEITVSRDKTFQAAIRLRKENPDKKIAVMNFANAFVSGGGVTKGSRAQEESLCRTSTLYPVIARPEMHNSYYAHNRGLSDPRATDSLIYSEDIIICKTDDDIPKRMAKEDWVKVDVITIAAPNLNSRHYPGFTMSDAELFDIHLKRAVHMLTVAASKGAQILILGAFGCGAFKNNPEIVSKAYRKALKQFDGIFEKIEFAIYCNEHEANNYISFSKEFENA